MYKKIFGKIKKGGQVTVELLLVLPVFMIILFFIMEIGNIAFNTILANHCAYELARIGALIAGPTGKTMASYTSASSNSSTVQRAFKDVIKQMFPRSTSITATHSIVQTLYDPQAKRYNEDIIVTLTYPAKLVFPVSNRVFADRCSGRKGTDAYKCNPNERVRTITAVVRMPVEAPYFRSDY